MKILIVTPSYKPAYVYGGPIFSVAYLAEQLSKYNEVLVLTTTANGSNELNIKTDSIQIVDGVKVIYFNRQTKDHSHFSIGLFKYLWNNIDKYDVIHIQSWWNLVAIFSLLICKIKKSNVVISPRGMLSQYSLNSSFFKRIFLKIIGINLLSNTKIHTTSIHELNAIKSINEEFNLCNIPNIVIISDLRKIDYKPTNNKLSILFLSRIHPKKGLNSLINILANVDFDFTLSIVGDGDKTYIDELKRLAVSLNISNKISWVGSKYGDEKIQMYLEADLFVLPSLDENFANTVVESLSVGTAVLLSKSVGLSDFVAENNLGWIYNDTIEDLKLKLIDINLNKHKLIEISERAPGIIKVKFSTEDIIQNYLNLYTLKND